MATSDGRRPTRTQRLFLTLLRPWAASIEAESREWILTCPRCGATRSIWDVGGVRWKAKGKPWIGARCAACGERSMQRLTRVASPAEPSP